MESWIAKTFARSRLGAGIASVAIVLVIGYVDYATGYEISIAVFYLLAITLAAWYAGKWWAVAISALSVTATLVGDIAAGASYTNEFVPAWNACITFSFYLLIVWLLARLKSFHRELEKKVRERTAELTAEMATRQKLEEELLSISEKEQQRIGRDLHDSLCQHLTGAALAGQVLEEKLTARSSPEIQNANRVVALIEQGIDLARGLARGLFPVLLERQGLAPALHELAANTDELSKIECVFESDAPVTVKDPGEATHLFRIAQEAVRNAVKHSGAGRIIIRCSENESGIVLAVEDDGGGLASPPGNQKGMGLQIMKHRASMIGARLNIESSSRGTIVTCLLGRSTAA